MLQFREITKPSEMFMTRAVKLLNSMKQEGLLDDIVTDFDLGDPPPPPKKHAKVVTPKRRKPVVYKGNKHSDRPEVLSRREIPKNPTLDSIIRLFAQDNKRLPDDYTLDASVAALHKLREYDRDLVDGFTGKNTEDEMRDLEDSIKRHGIKSAGVVWVRRKSNGDVEAQLQEGNHRLAIARKLGIKKMPVRFYFANR